MSLTEDDFDRMGDKLKIAVAEAMAMHLEKIHAPLTERLERVEKNYSWFKGALAVFGLLFAIALALIGRGK
jgi:hypothetical protein